MSKKELLQRVNSLEEYPGLSFIKPDDKDGYVAHIVTSKHGLAAKVEKLIE